jgi:phosphonate transport system ATP-binding protein
MITVRNLTKVYGHDRPALEDVSLTIGPGEFVVLLGPSGVGKSTLLRCLNYLVRPTGGEVTIDGQTLGALSRKELHHVRRRIGMIFQEFNLVGRLSVLTNVLCGRLGRTGFLRALTYSFSREDYDAAVRALRRAGLDDESLYLRRADTLSGGQKQRVAIARVLIQQPRVILADEPIASLDLKMQHTIMELIAEIAANDGITVVMSLHNVEAARRYASRIVCLTDGRVAFDGPREAVTPEVLRQVFDLDLASLAAVE